MTIAIHGGGLAIYPATLAKQLLEAAVQAHRKEVPAEMIRQFSAHGLPPPRNNFSTASVAPGLPAGCVRLGAAMMLADASEAEVCRFLVPDGQIATGEDFYSAGSLALLKAQLPMLRQADAAIPGAAASNKADDGESALLRAQGLAA